MSRPWQCGFLAVVLFAGSAAQAIAAAVPSLDEVNGAKVAAPTRKGKRAAIDAAALRAQILLDRRHLSPGSIDGRSGDNLLKPLAIFAETAGLPRPDRLTPDLLDRLAAEDGAPVLVRHKLTKADVAGPYLDRLPAKMEEMATLDRLSYTSAKEKLAERFHMSPALLQALNPGVDFDRADTEITVAAVRSDPGRGAVANRNAAPADGGKPEGAKVEGAKVEGAKVDGAKSESPKSESAKTEVVRIEVDKKARGLKAFAEDNRLVAYYPASVGSAEKPAPSGEFKIRAIARNPDYTYNPDYAFKGVKAKTKLTIAPGPNNPVGTVWLDLTADSYGIHGTPEPERIGRGESHGCIRLTNWDVEDLASKVAKGTVVQLRD